MSTLTIRLPNHKRARLRHLAAHRDMSVNKLMKELATTSLAEFDAETRFRTLAAHGSAKNGLTFLDKLVQAFDAPPACEEVRRGTLHRAERANLSKVSITTCLTRAMTLEIVYCSVLSELQLIVASAY